MSSTDVDEARLTESLHQLAGRVNPSPDALDAVRARYDRHRRSRRNRARLTAVAGSALAAVVAVAAVSVTQRGSDTEVSSAGGGPSGAAGQGESAPDRLLPVFVSVPWLEPNHIGLYEGLPTDGGDRSVRSSYAGEGGRNVQLSVEHNPPWTIEERAAERGGPREEVAGPSGARVTLVWHGGRYLGFWVEGEWQFELTAGQTSRDETLEILQNVTIDAAEFDRLKLTLRENVYEWRPSAPPVEHVVTSGSFEGHAFRVTELASPEGQRCLGLEPQRGHRWFCLPADAGAFAGEDPSIRPGQKVQVGDYWLYAALVEMTTTVRVHTETSDGIRHTVTLAPAPLSDRGMGVAVGFLPTTVENITTEFVDAAGTITYTTTQSMAGG